MSQVFFRSCTPVSNLKRLVKNLSIGIYSRLSINKESSVHLEFCDFGKKHFFPSPNRKYSFSLRTFTLYCFVFNTGFCVLKCNTSVELTSADGLFFQGDLLLLAERKEHQVAEARILQCSRQRKREICLLCQPVVLSLCGKALPGLIFAGGSRLPQDWEDKTSFCSSVAMRDSCNLSSGLSLSSIFSAKINVNSAVI